MGEVNLTKAVRANLLSLQDTAGKMSKTQNRLATGLKVNTALDNPSNFFTASALNSRAGEISSLLDAMSSGIKVIEAADNGLTAITKTVESMQSTLRQARQDKSFQSTSFAMDNATIGNSSVKTLSFTGGQFGSSSVSLNLNTTGTGRAATAGNFTSTADFAATTFTDTNDSVEFDINVDGATTHVTISGADVRNVGNFDDTLDDAAEFSALLAAKGVVGVSVSLASNKLKLTSQSQGADSKVEITNFADHDNGTTGNFDTSDIGIDAGTSTAGIASIAAGKAKSVDALVTEINANGALKGRVRASNDNGKLRIENLSTEELTLTGIGSDGEIDGTANTTTIGGNTVRANLAKQFNDLRDQLDKLAGDASFNGINLLRGDKLKLTFNEIGTSTIEIQARDDGGSPTTVNATTLGIESVEAKDFDNDATLDTRLSLLQGSLNSLRSQSSNFGSNMSVVQNRTDFAKKMINTLETGASNLTLADTNEEAANLLALQTRQQLSQQALSMASQADQAVLRLF